MNLIEEPLVEGTDRLIDLAIAARGSWYPESGIRLLCSDASFDVCQYCLDFVRLAAERFSNWYWSGSSSAGTGRCPALFAYFSEAPTHLYVAIYNRA